MTNPLIEYAGQLFENVPYYLAQQALGVPHGDFASHWDSEITLPYKSRFMNEVGGQVLEKVRFSIGSARFKAFADDLFSTNLITPIVMEFDEAPTDAQFDTLANLIADRTLTHVVDVFLGVDPALLAEFAPAIAAFCRPYVEAEFHDNLQSRTMPAAPNA